jgi:hypothetical protein
MPILFLNITQLRFPSKGNLDHEQEKHSGSFVSFYIRRKKHPNWDTAKE